MGREDGRPLRAAVFADNRHGIRLKWAAPVKLTLLPEYVKRIEIRSSQCGRQRTLTLLSTAMGGELTFAAF
jgi:hypothetical protein